MKRITISLPDDLGAAVEREARRRRVPVSQVIRERLETGTDQDARVISFAAIGRSGRRSTARNAEAILAKDLARRPSSARSS